MSFLHGKELQEEIKKCLSSKSAKRCAVAYIGRGAFDIINGKCEILCDLFSSGTNPKEVKRLFNKKNVTIRHQKDLHTKIYSTENFVILGSANMTNHALNFDGSDNTLIEACSKFEKKKLPQNYSAAREFVDSLWNDGVVVTEKMIDNAIEEYESGERENIPSRLNITDFCDGSNYICLYTDANLSKEGKKTANRELGANWSCKDYTVWENWEKLPCGYFFDLYWHPKSGKIEYCGLSKYDGIRIPFEYENDEDEKGVLYISNTIKMNGKDKKELTKFINGKVIPLVQKKYSIEEIDNDHDGGIILSLNDLLD